MRTGHRGPLPLVLLFALVLGFAIERLVVTDAEAVESLLKEARKAVEERDFARLRPLLSEDFRWRERGPDAAVERLVTLYEKTRPTRIDITWGPVVPAHGRAEVQAQVRAWAYGAVYQGEAQLVLTREPGGWCVLSLEAEGG